MRGATSGAFARVSIAPVASPARIRNDGTRYAGYVYPSDDDEISSIQPTIATDESQVNFWLGAFPPRPGQLERGYEVVRKTAEELFPVRYRALVPSKGTRLEGEVPAFLRWQSPAVREVVELT
jgi:hypothetical protein